MEENQPSEEDPKGVTSLTADSRDVPLLAVILPTSCYQRRTPLRMDIEARGAQRRKAFLYTRTRVTATSGLYSTVVEVTVVEAVIPDLIRIGLSN